ncbi:hypothetical protein SDC9_158277 [bioreactor metagenome]|uniref:Uncharacterized protein n=1 Tax=bioreactor metagenome TaxID=1076179 RepID=A0A645FCB0_9ZZZZ
MYTHELADALRKLATVLKKGQNVELGELSDLMGAFIPDRSLYKSSRSGDLPLALNALLSLSSFDKTEWVALIGDLGLPIQIRPRDASRDIMGKVLKHLEVNPDARKRLEFRVHNRDSRASPELARALSSLLSR